jgi:hypothetical protein
MNQSVPVLQTLVTLDHRHYIFFNMNHFTDDFIMKAPSKASYNYYSSVDDAKWLCNGDEPAKILSRDSARRVLIVTCRGNNNEDQAETTTSIDFLTVQKKDSNNNSAVVKYETQELYKCHQEIERNEQPTYQRTENSIGSCVMIAGDRARSDLLEWVEYHRLIGIEHFWVFMNENRTLWNGTMPERPYITYIPLGYPGKPFYTQSVQQNECIYRSHSYGLDWVALQDVDEYFRIVLHQNNQTTLGGDGPEPLTLVDLIGNFEQTHHRDSILGFTFFNWYYGKGPDFKKVANITSSTPRMKVDYVQRRTKPVVGRGIRTKMIVRPTNVDFFAIHTISTPRTPNGTEINLDPHTEAYHAHYKRADELLWGWVHDPLIEVDTSIRDTYRKALVQAMRTDSNNGDEVGGMNSSSSSRAFL